MAEDDAGRRDPLTGVLKHEAFLDAFTRRVGDAEEEQGSLSLAVADLDWFARVNAEQGRAVGDAALKAMTRHLARAVAGSGSVYRYGGDEFLVLLPRMEKEPAFLALEQARASFGGEHALEADGTTATVRLAFSVGIATYPDDGRRLQGLLRKASDAVYRAKARGGNTVCLAREERMVTKTSHYTQGQLERLSALAKREGVGEAVLLREALDDLLRKYSL